MARHTTLLATLLLAALAATASAGPRATRRLLADNVAAACQYVTVPQLCTSLAARSGATSFQALTVAAVNEALSTAEEAKATVDRIVAAPITDEKLKAKLGVCLQNFGYAVDTLQKAATDLQTGAAHSQSVSHISASVTYVGNCNDAFSENPGLVSPVADITSILKKLVSNSLGLAIGVHMQASGN